MSRVPFPRVVLAGFYPPPFGGESVHVHELARRLRETGSLKAVVNVRRGACPSLEYTTGAGAARLSARLTALLDDGTLLHLHSNGHSWKSWRIVLAAGLVLRTRRTSGVLTIHSGMASGFVGQVSKAARRLLRWTLHAYAHVICVNEEIRDCVVGLGARESRCTVIPAFLGLSDVGTDAAENPLPFPFRPLISVVAGDGPEYGVETVIRAVDRLRSRRPEVGCVVIGTHGTEEIRSLLHDHGLEDRIRLLGPQDHAECLRWIARSDVFVRPSSVDGDSISVREALSMRVPVVASETAFRPGGVTLFPVENHEALASRIDEVVRADSHRAGPESLTDSFARIVSVYADAARQT